MSLLNPRPTSPAPISVKKLRRDPETLSDPHAVMEGEANQPVDKIHFGRRVSRISFFLLLSKLVTTGEGQNKELSGKMRVWLCGSAPSLPRWANTTAALL